MRLTLFNHDFLSFLDIDAWGELLPVFPNRYALESKYIGFDISSSSDVVDSACFREPNLFRVHVIGVVVTVLEIDSVWGVI